MVVVVGVQLEVAAGLEMVTRMVVFFVQLAAAPTEVLLSPTWPAGLLVGTVATGLDLSATTEVGTASLVETATLLTGAASVAFEGAGAFALDTAGAGLLDGDAGLDSTALLDSAGWVAGVVVGLLAGVELGAGAAVVEGLGSTAPCLAGTMFLFRDKRAWVTSRAESC